MHPADLLRSPVPPPRHGGGIGAHVDAGARAAALVAIECDRLRPESSPAFVALLEELAEYAARHRIGAAGPLLESTLDSGQPVRDALAALGVAAGEELHLAGVACLATQSGRVGCYLHHDRSQAALVSVASDAPSPEMDALLRKLCMHIVLFEPARATRSEFTAEHLERMRAFYREEVADKPHERQAYLVERRLEQFFARHVLGDQPWILDPSKRVERVLEEALGKGTKIESFARIQIGK